MSRKNEDRSKDDVIVKVLWYIRWNYDMIVTKCWNYFDINKLELYYMDNGYIRGVKYVKHYIDWSSSLNDFWRNEQHYIW